MNGLKSGMNDKIWPKVSLIVANLNVRDMLRECLRSIYELDYPDYEVIVVDTGSTDGAPDMVSREFPGVKLIRERMTGVIPAINKGLVASRGDIIAFVLNNDETYSRAWLKNLVDELCLSEEKKIVGGVRAKYEARNIVQAAGIMRAPFRFHGSMDLFPYRGMSIDNLPKKPFEVDYLYTLVFRRELIDLIGLCDEKFRVYFEDADYCERARRAGYKILTVPNAVSYHRGGVSLRTLGVRGFYYLKREEVRFFIKHYELKWMLLSLIKWAASMMAVILSCLLGRARIGSRRLSAEESCELCRLFLKSILWNVENIGDHVRSRLMLRSIRPSA
jgi:GT2 family glycosyltransferase